ncbi:hypothetical protein [Actinoplanes sp. CA-252034]|uniref:hypothetical protein n=1 Tax=Actinoplanes sp. CA-252034 TaxID=3239906 RepID=UPI003D9672DC
MHHRASKLRDSTHRRRVGLRNTLWFTWLRRPLVPAVRRTLFLARTVPRDRASLLGAVDAVRGLSWLLADRRPRPAVVEARLGRLDEAQRRSTARRYVG